MLVKLRQNGYGLEYGACFSGEQDDYNPWFDDANQQFSKLMETHSQVMSGEPGAGKSHITTDLFRAAYSGGMMSCMLACHINSGSMAGRQTTQEMLTTAKEAGEECLVVVDNLDFMIYSGSRKKRRSDAKLAEYADFVGGALLDCLDADCTVLATVHSDEWRARHSRAPETLWQRYQKVVTSLGGEQPFAGTITSTNAERLLLRRNIEPELAASITGELTRVGALLFRQAHHISPSIFTEQGIEAAVEAVDKFKDQKIAGGA